MSGRPQVARHHPLRSPVLSPLHCPSHQRGQGRIAARHFCACLLVC